MRKRHLQFGVAVLVAAATAGLLTQIGLGGSDKVQIGNGSVSALAHAASAADTLPQSVLDYPFAGRNFASATGGGSRLLQEQGSLRLYAVPGKSGMLCLVEVDTVADTAGGACADRGILRTGSIYMADRQEDGSRLVVGLVGDGHTYAEANGKRAPVQNNAFVLNDVEGGNLTVGSPTASQQIDIGG
ncbi:MAG: hypothetical protein ACXWZ1_04295 [Gaiellaceae bacterium]